MKYSASDIAFLASDSFIYSRLSAHIIPYESKWNNNTLVGQEIGYCPTLELADKGY